MANPCFGKWQVEDDVNETDVFGVVPSAEEEALKRLDAGGKVREIRRQGQQLEKLIFKVKNLFSGPEGSAGADTYRRPFSKGEAAEILHNAGLCDLNVFSTYLSRWAGCGYYDPIGFSQVIVVGRDKKEAELYLRYETRMVGWRVVKARRII